MKPQHHYTLDDETHSVVNESGESYTITCYSDLRPYYAYISGKEGHAAAQHMLKNVFNGEKVMTDLIARTREGY